MCAEKFRLKKNSFANLALLAAMITAAACFILPEESAAQMRGCCEPAMIEIGTWPMFQGDSGRRGVSDQDFSTLPFKKRWEFDLGRHTWRYYSGISV